MSFSRVPEQGRVWEQCQVEGRVECQSCDPQIVYFQSVYVAITQPVREMRLYVIVVLVIALAIKGNTSQVILDTSYKSVFDSRLRVKGRKTGSYNCQVSNNVPSSVNYAQSITGIATQHL